METQTLTKECENLAKITTIFTHMVNDVCMKGFRVSAGFDIWGSFCFGTSTVDGEIGKPFATSGTAFSWLVAVANVLSMGILLLISIGVNPEADEGNFFFTGTAIFSDGDCDLSAVTAALARILGTSVRDKLGKSLVSGCCCTEA
jgi:hypothetical protein